jgi:hypothetical protein
MVCPNRIQSQSRRFKAPLPIAQSRCFRGDPGWGHFFSQPLHTPMSTRTQPMHNLCRHHECTHRTSLRQSHAPFTCSLLMLTRELRGGALFLAYVAYLSLPKTSSACRHTLLETVIEAALK